MTYNNSANVIIEIDDQVELLIEQINGAPNEQQQQDFMQAFQGVVIDSITGPFGLSAAMFADKDGGNITTVHNFEKGVVANDADARRHESWQKAQTETFDRSDYEKALPKERKNIFKQDAPVVDAYTGKELPRDGRAVRDHVVSAHEVEMSAKGHLAQSREERVATANHADNKVWAETRMNSSKGDRDLLEWANRPNRKNPSKTNAEAYGSDPQRLQENYEHARKTVDKTQSIATLKKQANEFLREGGTEAGKLAFRQVIGLFLKDLAEGLIQDIKTLMRDGFESLKQLAEMLKQRIEHTIETLKNKWAEYLKEGASAGITGFFSSLLTLLINSLITTAKNIVTIIREGTLAVVRAVKTIVAPAEGMSQSDIVYEVFKILSGAVVLVIGIGFEESLRTAVLAVPLLAPLASVIAPVVTAILSGTTSLLVVLAFDQLKNYLAFRNKQIADLHRGQSVTLLRIKRTVVVIGQASNFVATTATQLRHEFTSDWTEIKKIKLETARKADAYSDSVDQLSNLLAKF